MHRWWRILKHQWLDEADTRRVIGADVAARLGERVHASERRHSGEIRVCVEASLPLSYLWRDLTARDRALAMFGRMRVWDTEHNNGVLIYLLLAERAIEIVADRGINRHVPASQWAAILASMREDFQADRYEAGLTAAIAAVDALLAEHFPLAADQANPNELPDAPHLR